jgi:hypothetical protein
MIRNCQLLCHATCVLQYIEDETESEMVCNSRIRDGVHTFIIAAFLFLHVCTIAHVCGWIEHAYTG